MRGAHICRTYIASGWTPAAYADHGPGSGMDHTGAAGLPSGEPARAGAVGAGSQPPTGTVVAFADVQRRVRQRREVFTSVIGSTPRPMPSERANACDGRGIGNAAMTTVTSVNGTPMTNGITLLPNTEKARCANTGLSQEVSLVVTVGIRSDRRQTA